MGRRSGFLLFAALGLSLSACATVGEWRTGSGVARCVDQFAALDDAVGKAGVGDAEYARIKGFPYFRVDRFLASYDFGAFTPAARTAWVDRLVARDRDARAVENANLPQAVRSTLESRFGASLDQMVAECGDLLRRVDHVSPDAHKALPPRARVGDHYSGLKRVAGFYPLTALAVNFGFDRWKKKNLAPFAAPPEALESAGELVHYGPGRAKTLLPKDAQALIASSRSNPLAIPEPAGDAADALIAAFAPVWQIDTASNDDRIGAPHWRGGRPAVDTAKPVTFTRFSHARYGGAVLLQINYMIWFPARPKQGGFDMLGGRLDGLIWRVTIGPDGKPLIYDAVHNCGCYHLFFPTARLALKPGKDGGLYDEGIAVAATAPRLPTGGRIVLRLASVSHYLRRVDIWSGTADHDYMLRDYHVLRSLPSEGGYEGSRRSLFKKSGVVKGTHRGERLWLWPMGIANPGAMRQWGTHATAFVGRRHFDDPFLIEDSFTERPGGR